jgi:integral membrane protein (TIGR01906 family)|tara:strand:- start:180 stop:887 length:708 start_codon:yes stop_codon:yes gene_type:complete
MNYKQLSILIVSVLMVLLVPIILYLYSFNSIAFDNDFYKKEFLKYNVYANLDNYDIEEINYDVLTYLKSGKNNELIKNDFFNDREQAHLSDVKDLIQISLFVYYLSLVLFLLLSITLVFLLEFNYKVIVEKFLLLVFFGSFLTLVDAFLFFVLSNLNFNFVFDKFHQIFFSAGTYIFNPEFERIVVLYPYGLFFDALTKIIGKTILSSGIMFLASFTLLFAFYKVIFLKILRLNP